MLIAQITDIDIYLLRFIHHGRIEQLDNVLYIISFLTTFVSISLLILLLVRMLKRQATDDKMRFYKALTVLLVSALLSFTVKNTLFRERPFIIYTDIEKLSEAGSSSFPSGHTLEAFAMAFVLMTLFPQSKYSILLLGWASLVAYTRMALGVHYPSDVLVGAVLGVGISYLTILIFDKLKWKTGTI